MTRICLTEKGNNFLQCPICERELLPAVARPNGLEIAFWEDFEVADGVPGLLVCGEFSCEYEEEVTFTEDSADAIPLSLETTLQEFEGDLWPRGPVASLREMAENLEEGYTATERPKLRCAAEYCRQCESEHREYIDKWLTEAGDRHPVSFHTPEGEVTGMVIDCSAEEFTIYTEESGPATHRKDEIWWERVIYPRKPTIEGRHKGVWILIKPSAHVVIQGHHLRFHGEAEFGQYTAATWDPAIAAALRMKARGDTYWEGIFRPEELERLYLRRDMVKIHGYWLEESGRTNDEKLVSVRTTDLAIAEALELRPTYYQESNDFGCWDGEIAHYSDVFPVEAITETTWYEDIQPMSSLELFG